MIDDKQKEPMLLRILPEQVSDNWDRFAPLLEKSLPPTVTNRRLRMSNVLRSILMEDLSVWIYYDEDRKERYVLSTVVREDKVTLGRDLLIYTFTSLGQVSTKEVITGFEVIKKYARGNDCNMILAYTSNKRITNFFDNLGAETSFNLIQMEV